MLRRLLRPSPGDTIVDLGCGSGRSLVWNHGSGAAIVGIDVAPYFAREALERGDLVLGDLRRLPFADAAFGKSYALDVFEHLSREALERCWPRSRAWYALAATCSSTRTSAGTRGSPAD
jgi:SAM-dependent methyltransferase